MARWVKGEEIKKSFGESIDHEECSWCNEFLFASADKVYRETMQCPELHPERAHFYFCNEKCYEVWLKNARERIEKENQEQRQIIKNLPREKKVKVFSGGLPSLGKRR